jgi:hypothetical protein
VIPSLIALVGTKSHEQAQHPQEISSEKNIKTARIDFNAVGAKVPGAMIEATV